MALSGSQITRLSLSALPTMRLRRIVILGKKTLSALDETSISLKAKVVRRSS